MEPGRETAQSQVLKNVDMRAHQQTSFIMSTFKINSPENWFYAKSGSSVLLFVLLLTADFIFNSP